MKEEYNPYAIELYIGEKRSGKTLSMVAETYEEIQTNKMRVFSNLKLNEKMFPDHTIIKREDLENFYKNKEEFTNAYFLIDETHIFLDSRKFMREGSQKIGYFLGQMGKRKNVFRGTSHFPHLLDFRLRSYCEKWKYIRKGLVINGIFKPIINNNKILSPIENDRLYIQIKPVVRKLLDFDFYYIQEKIKYLKAQPYFKAYDTEELIIPDDPDPEDPEDPEDFSI